MNHHTRQPRMTPTTALDIRSEICFLREKLASGSLGKSGPNILDQIRDWEKKLIELEPWLAE